MPLPAKFELNPISTDLAVGGSQFADDAGVFRRADSGDHRQAHGHRGPTAVHHLKEVQPETEVTQAVKPRVGGAKGEDESSVFGRYLVDRSRDVTILRHRLSVY